MIVATRLSPSPRRGVAPIRRLSLLWLAITGLALSGLAAGPGRGFAQGHTDTRRVVSSTPATAAALADTARVRRWREEVRAITQRVRHQHPRPFAFSSEAAFDSSARAIEARIATSDDARLAVECMRMVAALGDAHTQVIGTLPPLGFTTVLPIVMRPFEDGLYVTAAGPEYAAWVGSKVTRIGELATDDALARVASATSADNRYTQLDRAPLFLMMPALLQALGVVPDRDRVSLEIERAPGKRERIVVIGGPPPEGFPFAFLETEPPIPAAWTSARRVTANALPRCDQRPESAWWFEVLPDSRAVYLRLRRIEPISGDLAYFELYRRLFAVLDSLKPSALIVDLRHDHGGNNTILDPLIRGIIARPWLDRQGALFALIDRGTFSAAMNAAVFLDERTRALFIGEPTGGRVNHYGDAPERDTPNFGMMLQVSTVPWTSRFPNDDRAWIAPEHAVPSTFADWREAKDRALDSALEALREGALSPRVLASAKRSGTEAAQATFEAWRAAHPSPWETDPHGDLAGYCADLIEAGEWRDAAVLGEVMVALDPRSSISWRLLGEAAAANGNRARAVECLKKTLEINPRAQVAAMMLRRLGEKP
ncbi:MAG: hypothetical protein HOP12_03530 [Candidatus Eisenbacteria bacterium]|uniref:Tetratricopeptide repeat protein n=1 Tax=Eiseniibacteriota bacterium TaxID=2212470 RepID=A0A849SCY0_UNCEI|nr:hypothetical protein [Candidatus Eisenbacteria bacterium]